MNFYDYFTIVPALTRRKFIPIVWCQKISAYVRMSHASRGSFDF
jgi:hypothetical protein